MSNPVYVYDFTVSQAANPDLSVANLKSFLEAISKRWGYQKEKGSLNDYVHYQGRFSLNEKKRKNTVLKLFKESNIVIHENALRVTSENGRLAANFYNYVTKEDTRIEGPWTDRDKAKYIPKQYRGKLETLRPWQEHLITTIEDFDDRKINWIYDDKGNNGKSTIAHLCRLHYNGVVLPIVNDSEKLIQSCCNILTSKKIRNRVPIFIDLPRAMDQEKLGGFITAIEFIMSGYVYDVRNTFKDWDFDTPCIWVFSNTKPNYNSLTNDRWNIWKITEKHEFLKLDECML